MRFGTKRINAWLLIGMALSFFLMQPAPSANATMYRCFDTTGNPVLTDSPAQLEDCAVLDPKKPSTQISPKPQRKAKRTSRPRHRHSITPPQEEQPPPELFSEEPQKEKTDDNPIEPITVPVTKIGGSMVVQVLFNNSVDAHLIVDTGATMTVISYDLGIELGLLSGSDVSLNTVNTAGGSVQVSMTKVGTVQVGSAKASNVSVAIHDLPDGISGVSGLLGMSFLRNFEVTLDADRGLLRLLPKSTN